MGRVAFLVDGFNLYHSLVEAELALTDPTTGLHPPVKWLDLVSICRFTLGKLSPNDEVGQVHYFSALAKHRQFQDATVTVRHEAYMDCLRETGVTIELGKFKEKWPIICGRCKRKVARGMEEKETDVAIGVRLLDLFVRDAADAAVLVTGDSDISPAIRCAREHRPSKPIFACFPFRRFSKELKMLANRNVTLTKEGYARAQFSDPFLLKSGRKVSKPVAW
jgi:uncharacterized LabA/DUF88 family protein